MSQMVVLCGVGGQGTILAAHILAGVASASGMDVKVSEIHGMAQRGGAVNTVVCYGDTVESMVSDVGEADIVVSFEMMEALRNRTQLKTGGTIITSDEVIKPASVLTVKAELPHNMVDMLIDSNALIVPAASTAIEAGNSKTSNVVMLGALSALIDFDVDVWESVISNFVPPKTLDVNLTAFRMGRAFVAEKDK